MPGQHRQRQCTICKKWMRSNNLKGHMKVHKDLLDLPDDQLEEELRARHDIQQEREAKIRKIEKIAKENDLAIPEEIVSRKRQSAEETDDVRARCLQNQRLYLEKIELGKQVASIIESSEVIYESLGRTDKKAFDTYQKYFKVDIADIALHKWQEEAMKFFDSSTERQVIWITDILGGKGKTFFKSMLLVIWSEPSSDVRFTSQKTQTPATC